MLRVLAAWSQPRWLATVGALAFAPAQTRAQAPQPIKIAVLAGLSGVYADIALGQVEAMQLAAEEVGGKVLGSPIEILSADHQNKPDVAASVVRKWYDDGVKMISAIDTSSVGLAVRKLAQEKGQIDLNVGSATADLTGPACSATGAHWVYDTCALAQVTGSAVVKDGGLEGINPKGHVHEGKIREVTVPCSKTPPRIGFILTKGRSTFLPSLPSGVLSREYQRDDIDDRQLCFASPLSRRLG
ncbi:hypothetical protein BH10PSE6_BH10PSE6_49890 [soil metagenome]